MSSKPHLTLHMAASLDGYVAKPDQSMDWMETRDVFEKGITLSEEDIAAFLEGIDGYVLGSKTYEAALNLGWPYGETPVFVFTSRELASERDSVQFISQSPEEWLEGLPEDFERLWLGGGPALSKSFLQADLVDEVSISLLPVLIGEGTPYFGLIGVERALHLLEVKPYRNGMVELRYEVRR